MSTDSLGTYFQEVAEHGAGTAHLGLRLGGADDSELSLLNLDKYLEVEPRNARLDRVHF